MSQYLAPSSSFPQLEPTILGLSSGTDLPETPVMALPPSASPFPPWLPPQADPSSSVLEIDDGNPHYHAAEVLRARLMTSAVVILLGCGAFFVRALFLAHSPAAWLRSMVMISTLYCIVRLISPRHKTSIARLRWLELLLFLPAGVQVLTLQFIEQHAAATQNDPAAVLSLGYGSAMSLLVLMLAYAMLMPNSWRRTLLMLAPLALCHTGVGLLVRWFQPAAALVITNTYLVEMQLAFLVTLAIAVYGARSIATLRRQVQTAQRLGQYHLKRLIEHGGMGDVYLAEHRLLKRPCALKVLNEKTMADPEASQLFEREVRATATLTHWHTVEIFDYGHTEDGQFYYVMEYLPGMNLARLIERFGPMSPGRVIHFMQQTCQALAEAHDLGMIHRDLKPANIFASKRGGVYDVTKLLDFGLVNETELDTDMTASSPGTRPRIAGSPHYMSPEQGGGDPIIDARSDIYSLGAVAYHLLTGRPPFTGSSPLQVLLAHSREEVVAPSELQPSVPIDLEAVVLQCLEKRPALRYPNVLALHQALADCADAGTWTEAHAATWWHTYADSIDVPELM